MDVVICVLVVSHLDYVEAKGLFIKKVELASEGVPRLWIYARPNVVFPSILADVVKFNAAFNLEYSWRVSLK